MKKNLLIAIVSSAMVVSAFAQGTVTFSASGGKIRYSTDGSTSSSVPAGNPATVPGYGQLNIAVYAAPAGTAVTFNPNGTLSSAWFESQNIVSQVAPVAGGVPANTVTLSASAGAAGTSLEVEVFGWTGAFADFNSAVLAGTGLVGWSGTALSGGSLGWLQGTGNPNGSPPTAAVPLVAGAGGFNGLVLAPLTPVPEPTTLALGGLGAAALLLFRRRKI